MNGRIKAEKHRRESAKKQKRYDKLSKKLDRQSLKINSKDKNHGES